MPQGLGHRQFSGRRGHGHVILLLGGPSRLPRGDRPVAAVRRQSELKDVRHKVGGGGESKVILFFRTKARMGLPFAETLKVAGGGGFEFPLEHAPF